MDILDHYILLNNSATNLRYKLHTSTTSGVCVKIKYAGDFDQTTEIRRPLGILMPNKINLKKEYLINNHICTHFIFLLELLK